MLLFYVIGSALLFVVPFFMPSLCFLNMFSFMPLIYVSLLKKTTILQGFLWGIIVFGAHLFWSLKMLVGYNFTGIKGLLWLFLIIFLASFAAIWFCIQKYLEKYDFALSWIFSTTAFVYFITYGFLFFCGVVEGYPFFNPFFIWAYYPATLGIVRYIGCLGALLLFVGFQVFVVLGYVKKTKYYVVMALLCLLPFAAGLLIYKPEQKVTIENSCFVTPWWFGSKEPMYCGYRMVSEVAKTVQEHKDVRFICMPESTFNWNIYEYDQFMEMMGQDAPHVKIAFGGHHRPDNGSSGLKSSFFVFCNGQKIFEYDKCHLIPFMERACPLFTALGLSLHSDEFFAYGDTQKNDVVEIDDALLQVFICSEFLVEDKKTKGIPVLFMCNDAWLTCHYAKRWIELFVRYFEIRYGVPVIFGTVCGKNNL